MRQDALILCKVPAWVSNCPATGLECPEGGREGDFRVHIPPENPTDCFHITCALPGDYAHTFQASVAETKLFIEEPEFRVVCDLFAIGSSPGIAEK